MTFEELSTVRYTQRSYDSKPVEDDKIQKILQAGRVAPTAKNNQPQKVYVVQSAAAMDKLRTLTPCHYNAPLAMIICYDKNQEWHNPTDETITSGVEDASIVATPLPAISSRHAVVIHSEILAKQDCRNFDSTMPSATLMVGAASRKKLGHTWSRTATH